MYQSNELFSLISFSFILVFGTLGNGLVVYVYGFNGRKGKRFMKFERLMLMLGVVDFISSLTNPTYYIYQITYKRAFHFGPVLCRIIPALGPIFTSISLGIILIMALDRDRAVVTPFKKQFKLKDIYKAITLTVVLCILITIPYIYYLRIWDFGTKKICQTDSDLTYNIMIVSIFLTSDILFISIFTFTTIRICRKLKAKDIIDCPKMKEYRARETNRILKIIIAMGVLFVICVFPRDLFLTSFSFTKLVPPPINFTAARNANIVLKVLHTSNSCVNIILYSCFNKKFRKAIFIILMKNKKLQKIFLERYPNYVRETDSYDSTVVSTNGSLSRSARNSARSSPINSPRNSLVKVDHDRIEKCSQTLLKHVLTKPLQMETKY